MLRLKQLKLKLIAWFVVYLVHWLCRYITHTRYSNIDYRLSSPSPFSSALLFCAIKPNSRSSSSVSCSNQPTDRPSTQLLSLLPLLRQVEWLRTPERECVLINRHPFKFNHISLSNWKFRKKKNNNFPLNQLKWKGLRSAEIDVGWWALVLPRKLTALRCE